jgi:arylsulfatase A-like enzyme
LPQLLRVCIAAQDTDAAGEVLIAAAILDQRGRRYYVDGMRWLLAQQQRDGTYRSGRDGERTSAPSNFRHIVLIGSWAVLESLQRPPSRTQDKPQAPNVVVLSIDTLRADSLRAYNPSAKPHATLDRMVQRGHTFDRAYSTASWTLPAHVSLFTGLYPDRHGVVDPRYAMGDVSSFVEKLQAKGYQTVGFTDGGYVGAQYGFTRGFENYNGWHDGKSALSPTALLRGGKRHFDTKATLFDRASAFLKARHDPRPLFLFVHTYAVHDYFRSWLPTQSDDKARPTPESTHELECLLGIASCAPAEWRNLEAKYEAGIDVVDRALGALLRLLDQRLGTDNTFVVLLSDHGEGFDHERHRIHHGGRLHRDQLQVPLLVTGPGVQSGRSREPVSLVDVGPSVLELVGSRDEDESDGRSFVAQLFGRSPQGKRDAIWAAEYYHYWEAGKRRKALEPSPGPLWTGRIGPRYWYIEGPPGSELYDVEDREQANSLSELLEEHSKQIQRRAVTSAKPSKMVQTIDVVEQLRALGYFQ